VQITLPYTHTFLGVGDPIEDEDQIVEFRLLFQGLVRPTGNKGHPENTHAIRRMFHPQLRLLWTTRSPLRQLAERWSRKFPNTTPTNYTPEDEEKRVHWGLEAMGLNWAKAGFNFVPLVTRDLAPACALDVLLLRPGQSMTRHILNQGDIDGQLKTIIDALRIPDDLSGTGNSQPSPDETPFFCLLQDDKLVSEVRVVADELLSLPGKSTVEPNDAYVVIHAKISHRDARTFDNYLG
jgi:hypothetical protein